MVVTSLPFREGLMNGLNDVCEWMPSSVSGETSYMLFKLKALRGSPSAA